MKERVYNQIIENYCFDNFYLNDVRVSKPDGMFKTVHRDYDLIVFTAKKILLFVSLEKDVSNQTALFILRSSLNSMVNKLSLSMNSFVLCGINEKEFFYLNTYNDRLLRFSMQNEDCLKLLDYIDNELSYGSDVYDYNQIRNFSDILSFSSEKKVQERNKEKTRLSADGTLYIKKHGTWKEASDLNTETLFLLAVFTGMFGMHLFYQKKRARGITYLLTFGVFGIGWFFDSLEILLGMYRDAEGKYLKPLKNRLIGFIMLLAGAVAFFLVGKLLLFLGSLIFSGLAETLSSAIINS